MGPLSKRAIAAIMLVFGLVTVIVVIAASGGDDEPSSPYSEAQERAQEAFREGAAGGQGADPQDGDGDASAGTGGSGLGSDGDGGSGPQGGSDGGSGGGSDGDSGQPGSPGGGPQGGRSDDSQSSQPGSSATEVKFVELEIRDNRVVGGFKKVTVTRDDPVRLRISSDVSDIVRVDGYNLSRNVSPSARAELDFTAQVNGVFEIGLEKRGIPIAYLVVKGDLKRR